jgi:hypothetical protein
MASWFDQFPSAPDTTRPPRAMMGPDFTTVGPPAAPMIRPELNPEARMMPDWNSLVLNAIPTVAAGAASALVPATAPARLLPYARMLAAGAGGTAGAAGRMGAEAALGRRPAPSATEAARELLGEGVVQAGGQGAAEVVRPILAGAARRLMSSALRVPASAQGAYRTTRAKMPLAMREDAPRDVVEMALAERIKLGNASNPRGTEKVERLAAGPLAEKAGYLTAQEQSGVTFLAKDPSIADAITALKGELRSTSRNPGADIAKVDKLYRGWLDSHRAGKAGKWIKLSPRELDRLKTAAGERAQPIFAAERAAAAGRTAPPSARQTLEAKLDRALNSGMRRALERATPDIANPNARLAQLMRLAESVKGAELRPEPGVPAAMHTLWGDLRGLADTPAMRSALALGADAPWMRAAGPNVPRALIPLIETMLRNPAAARDFAAAPDSLDWFTDYPAATPR